MATLVYPNNFTPGTTISSSQVNANFAAVSTLFNTTGFGDANITPGGISHVSLANASVQKDTINSNVFDQTTITGGAGVAASIAAGGVALSALASAVAAALVPTGGIIPYGGSGASDPTGWLVADGRAVSRTTYAALYAVIGNAYGTDGGSNFNIPDLRGKFIRGTDNMGSAAGAGGNDPDAASRTAITGGATGNNVGSIQSYQVQGHTHTVSTQDAGTGTGAGSIGHGNGANSNTQTSSSTGGSETRPINLYTNFIIKT